MCVVIACHECYSVLPTLVSFVFIVVWLCQAEETSHRNVTVFYHLGKFCIYCGVVVSSRGNITSQCYSVLPPLLVLYLLWCGCVKQRKHNIAMLQCFTHFGQFCIYCGVVVSSRGNITLQCYSVLPPWLVLYLSWCGCVKQRKHHITMLQCFTTLVSFVFIVVWLCQAEET